MRKLSLQEIKEKELDILLETDRICRRHDISLKLVSGTLLGAVRHKGFIPWDDDIDTGLSRPDYNRFIDICEKELPDNLRMLCYEKKTSDFPFCKIVDTRYQVEMEYLEGTGYLWIDIFPFDGLPESDREVEALYRKTAALRKLMQTADAKENTGKTELKRVLKRFAVPILNIPGRRFYSDRIYREATKYNFDECIYCGGTVWGLYGSSERIGKAGFLEDAIVEFEGHSFHTMGCWDEYLSHLYGDYMTLPPENERPTHDMAVWEALYPSNSYFYN